MLSGGDASLAGAAEAIAELWQMADVTVLTAPPTVQALRDFLSIAGIPSTRARLAPVPGPCVARTARPRKPATGSRNRVS
jgi:hypothetical protein